MIYRKATTLFFLNKSMLLNCLSKNQYPFFLLNSSSKLSEICPEDKLKTKLFCNLVSYGHYFFFSHIFCLYSSSLIPTLL